MELHSNSSGLPPLPDYTLTVMPSLVAPIPDKLLSLLLPIAAYWILSMLFHWIDVKDYFSQYRLHTPAEVLKRNHVTRWEVIRDVIIQQVIQTVVGWILEITEPDDYHGKENYDMAVWGQRIRLAQRVIPVTLNAMGIDAVGLASKLSASHPDLAGAIAGGVYPSFFSTVISKSGVETAVPGFAPWEMMVAQAIYWVLVPAMQFAAAILIVDTWQYFLHRAMHMNKWLYSE